VNDFAGVIDPATAAELTRLIIKAHNIDMHPNGPYSAIKITD